jgi:hypothetical protein
MSQAIDTAREYAQMPFADLSATRAGVYATPSARIFTISRVPLIKVD